MAGTVVVVQAVCLEPSDLGAPLAAVWTVPAEHADDELHHLMDVCDGEMWHESGVQVTESMRLLEARLDDLAAEGRAAKRQRAARVALDGAAAARVVTLWFWK